MLDFINSHEKAMLLVGSGKASKHCLSAGTIEKLQRVQNCAARVITGVRRSDHITPVLNVLHWLRISERIEYKVLLLAYKCLHNSAPEYLKTLLTVYQPNRRLHSTLDGTYWSDHGVGCSLTFGDRAFSSAAPSTLNSQLLCFLQPVVDSIPLAKIQQGYNANDN
jgi:hypothetical protein